MFEYACDPEIAQNSNCLVSRDHMFFPEMAHFFQLSDPEIAQFELEILITCFLPQMARNMLDILLERFDSNIPRR